MDGENETNTVDDARMSSEVPSWKTKGALHRETKGVGTTPTSCRLLGNPCDGGEPSLPWTGCEHYRAPQTTPRL
jgi:hypothetical protein